MSDPIRTVLVLGAGTMGHGIAQVAAVAGCAVRLFDVDPKVAAAGVGKVAASLGKLVEKGKLAAADRDAALARLTTTSDLRAAAAAAGLAVIGTFGLPANNHAIVWRRG